MFSSTILLNYLALFLFAYAIYGSELRSDGGARKLRRTKDHHPHQHESITAAYTNNAMPHRRIAVIWTFNSDLPYYFELSLATLLTSGAELIDIHVLVPRIPDLYTNGSNPHYAQMEQVYFHTVSSSDWHARIRKYMNITLPYDLSTTHRKSADFKPMLAALFPDIIRPHRYSHWIYGDSDGLFGSYDALLDHANLPIYDIISGFPLPTGEVQVLAGSPLRCTGAWTMLKTTPKITSLYKRSVNWRSMALHGDQVYAFDEHTKPVTAHVEDFHMVLARSQDVTQCCQSHRQPLVKKGENSAFIVEMMSRFIEVNGTVIIRWSRSSGLFVTAMGNYGFNESYKNETVNALFVHFLQWKYACGDELKRVLVSLISAAGERGGVWRLECFEITAGYKIKLNWRWC